MKTPLLHRWARSLATLRAGLCASILLALPVTASAQGTGTITGRVHNEGTGQYLRSAVVKVSGTGLSTLSEAGGSYTISGVPAGAVTLAVSYADLDAVEVAVDVPAGGTTTKDIGLTSRRYGEAVKLGTFVVAAEREGNAKALQEQRQALEMKTVIASDAFGDVSEGNVGEFLKLMPGVQMDYVEADVRTMSIGGLDPKYSTIMMDGAPLASAGSSNIGTGRVFEFEQLSIASIETIELSKTPTPDVAGSALAGVVNLRSKGAFDRRGRLFRWQTSLSANSLDLDLKRTPGPKDKTSWKLQPNVTLEYSDVFKGRIGVLAGFNYSYSFAEQKANANTFVFDADPTNNRTEVPRLQSINLQDSPKPTVRKNHNLRLDYKLSNELFLWLRGDYNTYAAEFYARDVNFDFRNPTGNANTTVNAPGSTVPADPSVEYSLRSQTSTTGRVVLDLSHGGQRKFGWTTTYATGASYRRGAFSGEVLGSLSRATNWYKDVSHGFFNSASTGPLPLNGVRWTRRSAHDPDWQIAGLGNVSFRDPAAYPAPVTVSSNDRSGEDQKWTAKADFRYATRLLNLPVSLKFGGASNLSVRNIDRRDNRQYTYLGPDGLPGTGDETPQGFFEKTYMMSFPFGTNVQNFPNLDRWALAREFGAHPERFTQRTAAQELELALRNHWDTKEQIDAVYLQPIIKLTRKLDLAPGVRWERTRGVSRGPNDAGNAAAQRALGNPPTTAAPSPTTIPYLLARYSSNRIAATEYGTPLTYLHATYRASDRLTFRASFNESITRPDLNRLAGGIIINNELADPPTATVPNPDLKPEHARNVFVSAEYYFPKGGGFLTASVARRDLYDLIRTTPNDIPVDGSFDGDPFWGGWRINTVDNVAKAHTASLELNYRQNLTFLPGIWRRLSVFANYTHVRPDNYENFRRPNHLANGGVSFGVRSWTFRWNANWTPQYRWGGYPANGWANLNGERLLHDLQVNWNFRRNLSFFLTGRNLFNQPTRTLYGSPSVNILNRYFESGSFWTIGVKGTFD